MGLIFKIGYSPERINPGDRVHRLEKIKKVASGMDEVIFAVPHEKFKNIILKDLRKIYKDDKLVLIDIKGTFDRKEEKDLNYLHWRL